MSYHHLLLATLVTCSIGLLGGADAAHANYNVTPIRAELSARAQSTLMTVRNTGAAPVRVQARIYQWQQDEMGEEHLSLTEDITFFPQMLQIEPGASRNVRLGLRVPVAASEQSYRIVFEELPGGGAVDSEAPLTAQLNFRTRISIPVFIKPPQVKQNPRVSIDRVAGGRFQFSIHNDGNVHLRVRTIQITGLSSASPHPLLNGRLDGWYVLPGTPRRHVLRFPQGRCADIDRLRIRVETTEGIFSEEMNLPPNAACAG